ncbi:phosphomevalonate kinase [Kwoniella dendrophila CBS 6074]|uniref:Phosphomevalonate kinase n=1 Tax=Kwoniella dendrophila CBS 6074 TaxID=1295534 RepID=A0AAX4K4A8_9TREE
MAEKSSKHTIVSSPGKVLLAGGYLVLDREYSGLVVATSSRFYSSVTSLPYTSSPQGFGKEEQAIISIRAGQFPKESSEWIYKLSINQEANELSLIQINEDEVGKNKFIYITLFQTIAFIYEKLVKESGKSGLEAAKELINRAKNDGDGKQSNGLQIVVLADNDFYSQREQLSALSLPTKISSLSSLKPFTSLPRPIPQTNKTGLGSSAALVTSLVASILSHLNIVSSPSSSTPSNSDLSNHQTQIQIQTQTQNKDLQIVHSLAQFSHCLAQGKVGSGFDISSAVFGTHLYKRFSPSILSPLMDNNSSSSSKSISLASNQNTMKLLDILEPSKWDHKQTKFKLPKGLRLILADVDAGTDTPSFVGKVLSWRKENPEKSKESWNNLDKSNMNLERLLVELAGKEEQDDYEETLARQSEEIIEDDVSTLLSFIKNNSIASLIYQIRSTLSTIREYQREMSELSGVPIEPPEQTRLLDACSKLPGVIGGGVPGAGGYDALFLLIIDSPSVLSKVDNLWLEWKEMSVCPLLAKQSDGGLRVEDLKSVPGLKEALER